MSPIAVYGAGGLGREIAAFIRSMPEWDLNGFYDDALQPGTLVDEVPVLGSWLDIKSAKDMSLVVAVGDPTIKKRVVERLSENSNIKFPSLVHPKALLMAPGLVRIGDGSVICAGSILTTGIVVGRHVLINLNCTIGHDSTVGDFSSLMPGVNVAGHITIGSSVLVGSGSQLIRKVTIGDDSKIGAGAVVLRNVKPGATVVGVPATERPRR